MVNLELHLNFTNFTGTFSSPFPMVIGTGPRTQESVGYKIINNITDQLTIGELNW